MRFCHKAYNAIAISIVGKKIYVPENALQNVMLHRGCKVYTAKHFRIQNSTLFSDIVFTSGGTEVRDNYKKSSYYPK